MKFAFRRPGASMVVAVIALVVATAGTSYAALTLPKNSVGTKQLRNGAVTTAKLAANSVNSTRLANNSVTATKLANGLTVPNALSANNAVNATTATNATNAVNATTATNATNAAELGGAPASAWEPRVLWAYVSAAGNVMETNNSAIKVVSHPFLGGYYVQFPETAEGKVIEVTPHDDENDRIFSAEAAPCGTDNTPAEISCASPYDSPSNVYVAMYDTSGYVDNGFYIAVIE